MGALEGRIEEIAGVAQLVERHVANVKVVGSSPITRSEMEGQECRCAGSPVEYKGAVAQSG